MKKLFVAAALFAAILTSCSKQEDAPEVKVTDYLVLNNGAWGANNAGVVFYDSEAKSTSGDAFAAANSKGLGDLGQDILVDGDEIYIAVNGSKVIFVTDASLKIKDEIVAKEGLITLSPRYMTKVGKKLYVTYYEGFLGEIDLDTKTVRTTAVGANPEGLACVDGKMYVANSGGYVIGYCNTVSVVDLASFKETMTITVNTNPAAVKAVGNKVFVSSLGNYYDVPAKVQCIDASSNKVTDLDCSSPSGFAVASGKVFVLCGGYDAEWKPLPGTVLTYDASTLTRTGEFVKDGTTLPEAYSISAAGEYLFVGCSDYKTNGTVYAFTMDGKLYDKFDSEGLNPISVVSK